MTRARDRWYAAFLALGALAVLVAAVRTVSGPSYHSLEPNDHVVVVGVPSLDWEVISPETMPTLWQLADEGGAGLITARAARSTTCPWDGWVTLGAGNRARYPATIPEDELPPEPDDPLPGEPVQVPPEEPEPQSPEEERAEQATEGCLGQRGAVPTVEGSQLAPAIVENEQLRFGAVPGALGTAVQCSTVVGGSPILAVGAEDADVRVADRGHTAADWSARVADCPLTLVATSHALNRTPEELLALDAAIAEIVAGAREQGATVIIAGIAQPEYKRAKLHALIASGPGIEQQVLSAPSTSRAPFSQLIDIAPTALAVLGEDTPSSMVGQVMRGEDRDLPLEEQVATFHAESVAASTHVWMSGRFFTFMTWLSALVVVALAGLLWRGRGIAAWMRAAGTVVASLPVSSLLANLYPWERAGRPSVAIIVCIASCWVLLSALCLLGPWRRHRSGPLLAACTVTFGTLALDVLTGSHLQLNSPLGYNGIVAGRFTGFGNITFAMYAAAGLVLLAAACRVAGTRRRMTILVGVTGLALIAMDGAPGAGADFGGVIALAPALLLLWMIATGTRLSRVRLLIVMLSGAAAVMAIAVADYLRPAADRTHLGRFVDQILDGTAITVIERKLQANIRVLTGSVLTLLAAVLLAVVVWQFLDRSSPGWRFVRTHHPYAQAAVVAVLVMAFVGFAVNDSGVAVIAAALVVVVPAALGMLADSTRDDAPEPTVAGSVRGDAGT
ncbi:hypothetical protein [Blastococcus sp. Marseille-P5729]|uniref:hypothetical protein n=1 Tax=Blastococcus sp. Marseille-P5729 TaxID=2086582 RepID=UPI000D0EA70A|nr:hypothetical protein [Blastococcus sp. Marseille-P5729]